MKIYVLVGSTPYLLLVCVNWIAAQGYNYNGPQHYVANSFPAQHFQQLHQTPCTNNAQNSINGNGQQTVGKLGDYVSQSEASELDQRAYPYKQKQPGDNRPFVRYVTTCYADGSCSNSDANNRQILQNLRTNVEFVSRQSNANYDYRRNVQPTFWPQQQQQQQQQQQHQHQQQQQQQHLRQQQLRQPNFARSNLNQQRIAFQLPNRPPDRRLYPYVETIRPNSFN